MAERQQEQPNPEQQAKQEKLKSKMESLQPRLEAAFGRIQAIQTRMQEALGGANPQELQERAQQGDGAAAEALKAFAEAQKELMQAIVDAYRVLEEARQAHAEAGLEEQWLQSGMGQQYLKMKEQVNQMEG